MFIAFEGPDNVGKSTAARELDAAGQPHYNATKDGHAQRVAEMMADADPLMPWTYDRIDWFSHMVYRLALPDREWNDARVRTVFAMPDTHLVLKMHKPDTADFLADEVVSTPIVRVNPVYWLFTDSLMRLNEYQGYDLFKSISIIEVSNTEAGYTQQMVAHSSGAYGDAADQVLGRLVTSNDDLLRFLQDVEQRTL